MRQRKKQPAVTRQAILAAAGAEFAKHGYAGSGLGPIVTAAGLTKGALFHHFPDKRALATAWLGELLAADLTHAWLAPLAEVSSLADLKRLCRQRIADFRPGEATVVLARFAAEMGGGDPVLAAAVAALTAAWRDALAAALDRGRAGGSIYPAVKPAAEAALCVAMLTGAAVGAALEDSVKAAAGGALEDYLDTLRVM